MQIYKESSFRPPVTSNYGIIAFQNWCHFDFLPAALTPRRKMENGTSLNVRILRNVDTFYHSGNNSNAGATKRPRRKLSLLETAKSELISKLKLDLSIVNGQLCEAFKQVKHSYDSQIQAMRNLIKEENKASSNGKNYKKSLKWLDIGCKEIDQACNVEASNIMNRFKRRRHSFLGVSHLNKALCFAPIEMTAEAIDFRLKAYLYRYRAYKSLKWQQSFQAQAMKLLQFSAGKNHGAFTQETSLEIGRKLFESYTHQVDKIVLMERQTKQHSTMATESKSASISSTPSSSKVCPGISNTIIVLHITVLHVLHLKRFFTDQKTKRWKKSETSHRNAR